MAGRRCTVCTHPNRQAVDLELATGGRHRLLADRYNLSRDAIRRHALAHVTAGGLLAPAAVTAAAGTDGKAPDVLATLVATVPRLTRLLDRVERQGQAGAFVAASRELRQVIETIGRLTGQTDASGALRRQGPVEGDATQRERLMAKLRALAGEAAPPTR